MDWAEACRILGVPESATDSEIKEQYIYKAHLLHPDKNQDKPENIRKRAEAEISLVNQSYSFLSNPNNNPYKIPPELSIEPVRIHFKDVIIGQKKATTLIIKNVGGPYTSIWIDNQPAPWLTVAGVKSLTSERLPLEVSLECQATGEPDKQYECDLAVKLENEKTHIVDQSTVKIELNTISEAEKSGFERSTMPSATKPNAAVAAGQYIPQPGRKNKMGFSIAAFSVNFLALAVIGIALFFIINIFVKLDNQVIFMTVSIAYVAISFGISFNHGITVGSTEKIKNKKH